MHLGLDIGTSAVKALLLDDGGATAGEAAAPLTVSRPQDRWSEQDPDDWWHAVGQAVAGLPRHLRRRVRGIGIAGQMHGAVLLDDADRPLRPAMLWNDGRADAECRWLETQAPDLRAITGNAAMPGFTAPKLLWVRRHEPSLFARIARILLPKDYVRLRMTGDRATDCSDASGTLWFDVRRRGWSDSLLAVCGLDRSHMPSPHEGPEVTGTLRREVAESWGMSPVPVVAGGGDNAAGAIGAGVIDRGQALLSLGTSGVIFAPDHVFRPSPDQGAHAFAHAVPGRWHQMAVMLSAAAALDWAARLLRFPDVGAAIAAAGARQPFASELVFLPYLSGERTPHNDPGATGLFAGLTHDSDPAAIMMAVMEGVAFALADCLAVLLAAGATINALAVIGGGARSALWGEMLAAALDRPLRYGSDAHSGPALGAARLARIGIEGAPVGEVAVPPPLHDIVIPDSALAARASARLSRWRRIYPAVRAVTRP